MAITSTVPEPGTYQNLQGHQQLALREWLGYARNGTGKIGLWIYGNRGEGSTYIGSVAVKRMADEVGIENWEYVTALDLMDQIRISWSADAVSRGNSNDYDLYVEAAGFEDDLTALWAKKMLWIDDLYSDQDMAFWRKHVMERLIQRTKAGLPTIICTDMSPGDRQLDGLQKTLMSRFVTCYAER